jgi:hypothetical protein
MPRISARHVLLAVMLFGSVLFLLYAVRTVPRGAPPPPADGPGDTPAQDDVLPPPAAPADADYSRYKRLAERSVFEPRRPPPPPRKKTEKKPQKKVELPDFKKPARPRLDLTGWSYVGYVIFDDVKVGIVQHESSTSVEYLTAGSQWLGVEVTEITDELIRLKSGGSSPSTLSRERDFPVTPLDKQASSATPTGRRQPRR